MRGIRRVLVQRLPSSRVVSCHDLGGDHGAELAALALPKVTTIRVASISCSRLGTYPRQSAWDHTSDHCRGLVGLVCHRFWGHLQGADAGG